MTAEHKAIMLTLPGPKVSRSITVEHVRAYLRSQGWSYTGRAMDDGADIWTKGHDRHRIRPDSGGSLKYVVEVEAEDAGVSPGEMLARMVDEARAMDSK